MNYFATAADVALYSFQLSSVMTFGMAAARQLSLPACLFRYALRVTHPRFEPMRCIVQNSHIYCARQCCAACQRGMPAKQQHLAEWVPDPLTHPSLVSAVHLRRPVHQHLFKITTGFAQLVFRTGRARQLR